MEGLDALDLVISVLREHERALDDAVARLEQLIGRLQAGERDGGLLRRFHEPLGP